MGTISGVFTDAWDRWMSILWDVWPKILGSLLIILLGLIVARIFYLVIIYLFKRFNLVEIINKLDIEIEVDEDKETHKKRKVLLTEKFKVDKLVWKSISYYIFILFFRWAVTNIGINDVEIFLTSVITYLPKLFIALLVWFFWVRFADFVYDVIFHTLDLAKQKSSKLLAIAWKIVILFFTMISVLHYVDIVSTVILNTLIIWFTSMISLAWGLAFGLWGKDIAKEILENLKK